MGKRVACAERERVSSWVSLDLDGRLAPDHGFEMEQHLASCPPCQAEAAALHRVSTLLSEMPMVGPSYGFALRVQRRLAERADRRRHLFRGVALLTSSLSVAGAGAAAVLTLGLGLAALLWLSSQPAGLQVGFSMSQVVSGLGLMGKGASILLKDIVLRYGLPVVLAVGGALAVMGGLWAWLVKRKLGGPDQNEYA